MLVWLSFGLFWFEFEWYKDGRGLKVEESLIIVNNIDKFVNFGGVYFS